jgi:4-amino-4-deoxy-L-arabinose transferase
MQAEASPTSARRLAGHPAVRLDTIAAGLIVLVMSFMFIGVRGIWEPDEGRYTTAALQMVDTGDWLNPRMHPGKPHFTKPPLTYWGVAASTSVFGRAEWAARLPGALAFAGTAGLVGLITRRLAPGRGTIAVALYPTSVLPFVASNIVTTDTLLTLWETLAVFALVMACPRFDPRDGVASPAPPPTGPAGRRTGWLVLMWTAFGLAFMTKGPPGLLPLAGVVPALAILQGPRATLRLFHPLGLAVFLVVGFSWYVAVAIRQPDLIRYFIENEVIARVASDQHGRNAAWYHAFMYPVLLLAGMLPWCGDWFQQGRWRWIQHPVATIRRDPALVLLSLWLLVPLVAFMLARSRMPLYVVPLMAPLAILTARSHAPDWLHTRRAWVAMLLTVAVLLGVRVGVASVPERDSRRLAREIDVPPAITTILYVNRKPWRGLYFYTDRVVEEIRLGDPGDSGLRTLDDVLAARIDVPLLAVLDQDVERVTRMVTDGGWSVVDRRPVRGDWFLELAPPEPSVKIGAVAGHIEAE